MGMGGGCAMTDRAVRVVGTPSTVRKGRCVQLRVAVVDRRLEGPGYPKSSWRPGYYS